MARLASSHHVVELILTASVLASLIYVAQSYVTWGGLPRPFNSDPSQSLMDFYNTAYWANRPGAYDLWHTVYPPLPLLFARLIASQACYTGTPLEARACDPMAAWFIAGIYLLNVVLVYLAFLKRDSGVAIPRTLTLCLGLPMLYGLDLANLIIVSFSFFVLAEGGLIQSPWLRQACRAFAFNFKLYLLVITTPHILQRRFRWLGGAGAVFLAIYLLTLALYGSGTPAQIVNDLLYYARAQSRLYLEENHLLAVSAASHGLWQRTVPVALRFAEGVALVGVLLGVWRKGAVDRRRLMALALSVLCTEAALHTQGFSADYTQIFLIFLLFLERGRGVAVNIAILMAYALCLCGDVMLVRVESVVQHGYYSGVAVRTDYGLTLSQFLRPLAVAAIQIALGWSVVERRRNELLHLFHVGREGLGAMLRAVGPR